MITESHGADSTAVTSFIILHLWIVASLGADAITAVSPFNYSSSAMAITHNEDNLPCRPVIILHLRSPCRMVRRALPWNLVVLIFFICDCCVAWCGHHCRAALLLQWRKHSESRRCDSSLYDTNPRRLVPPEEYDISPRPVHILFITLLFPANFCSLFVTTVLLS